MDPVEAFETLAATQLELAGVTRRTMFGRDTLLADGHPYAFRDDDRVALKLPDAGQLVGRRAGHGADDGAAGDAPVGRGPLGASDELTTLLGRGALRAT